MSALELSRNPTQGEPQLRGALFFTPHAASLEL